MQGLTVRILNSSGLIHDHSLCKVSGVGGRALVVLHPPHFFFPHSAQNLAPASFLVPHSVQNHSAAGLGEPHSGQNLPVQTAPQEQVQPAGAAGLGEPHSAQNLPVLT